MQNDERRLYGGAALVAGFLTTFFWLIHPLAADPHATHGAAYFEALQSPRYVADNGAFILLLILYLFAMIGMHRSLRERAEGGGGLLGLVGYAVGFMGTAAFVGAGFVATFVQPALAAEEATRGLLEQSGALFGGPMGPVLAIGGLSFGIGNAILGISLARTRALPRWAGISLALSAPILGLSPLMPLIARASGSALFGVATMALGWAILRGAAPEASEKEAGGAAKSDAPASAAA